jgi:hypothetical protein
MDCGVPAKPGTFSRRKFFKSAAKALVAVPLAATPLLESCKTAPPPLEENRPFKGSDNDLLDELERTAFKFFWEQAYPTTGLIKDRTHAFDSDTYYGASIASVGFGLTALCIGDSRGYKPTTQIRARIKTTLNTLLNKVQQHQGFFYHFLNWKTGERIWSSELSSMDTAILMCGALTVRQYFSTERTLVDMATQIYDRVNWPWMMDGGTTLSMGWIPERGFLRSRWEHYCELMMMYLLGIGSPTHPLSPDTWRAWSRPTFTYEGITYISSGDPLFTHQYSQAWFDFRNRHDEYADYFQNSVNATMAHKLYCLSLERKYPDYSADLWGFSASDAINGYVAWGGPPGQGPIDGSIVPCAVAGSLPFLYKDCIEVLRTIRTKYPRAWSRYGYTDAFNPTKRWYNADVLGIDLGISMLMAENQRTGFVWNYFMKNAEAQRGMALAGFKSNDEKRAGMEASPVMA